MGSFLYVLCETCRNWAADGDSVQIALLLRKVCE